MTRASFILLAALAAASASGAQTSLRGGPGQITPGVPQAPVGMLPHFQNPMTGDLRVTEDSHSEVKLNDSDDKLNPDLDSDRDRYIKSLQTDISTLRGMHGDSKYTDQVAKLEQVVGLAAKSYFCGGPVVLLHVMLAIGNLDNYCKHVPDVDPSAVLQDMLKQIFALLQLCNRNP